MSTSVVRIEAVMRKELREFRRNRFIVGTMVFLPLLFVIVPTADLFRHAAPALVRAQVGTSLLLLLVAPVVMPAAIAAYAVVGEREQGTLEPVLTTPVRREELLLGKAVAAILPTVGIAYLLFAIVVVAVRIGAGQAVVSQVWQAPNFLAQALFAPLLAGWSIWVGIAISARSSDVRVAQQLGTLASLPPLGIVALMSFQVIQPSIPLAIILASVLALVDIVGWRFVAATFDRERLITGSKPAPT
jgi:ABC-type Na+ efflux pump permease subunit